MSSDTKPSSAFGTVPLVPPPVVEHVLTMSAKHLWTSFGAAFGACDEHEINPVCATFQRAFVDVLCVLPHQNHPGTLRLALFVSVMLFGPYNFTNTLRIQMDLFAFFSYLFTLSTLVGHNDRFQWYFKQLVSVAVWNSHSTGHFFVSFLCTVGHMGMLETLHAQPTTRSLLIQGTEAIVAHASSTGNIRVLDFWLDHKLPVAMTLPIAHRLGDGGNVPVFQWWIRQQLLGTVSPFATSRCREHKSFVDAMVAAAVRQGHIALLESMFNELHVEFGRDVVWSRHDGWANASRYGHIELLDWAARMSFPVPEFNPNSIFGPPCLPMDAACEANSSNSILVLDWWLEWTDGPTLLLYSGQAMESASDSGRLDVLNWWLNSGLPLAFTPRALEVAMGRGHSQVVEWWHQTCTPFRHVMFGNGQDLHDQDLIPQHPVTLASHGRLAWLKAFYPLDMTKPRSLVIQTLAAAAKFGHLHILQEYQHWLQWVLNDNRQWSVPCIAASNGQLAVLQWWFQEIHADRHSYDQADGGAMGHGTTARILRACIDRALGGDHAHVLRWLFAHPRCHWDMQNTSEEVSRMHANNIQYALIVPRIKCLQLMFDLGLVKASMADSWDHWCPKSQDWWRHHFTVCYSSLS